MGVIKKISIADWGLRIGDCGFEIYPKNKKRLPDEGSLSLF